MESSHTLFSIGPLQVNSQMTTMLAISVALILVCYFGTRNMRERPGRLQNALEKVVEMLLDFFAGVVGEDLARRYLPFLGTMFLFILFSNYSGLLPLAGKLPGLAAPTSSLSVTAGLAVCTFFTVQYAGFAANGLKGYAHHFTKPIVILAPLFLIEEFIRPLSLSLRLYGNIYGEEAVTEQIAHLAPLLAPIVIQVLSLLLGFVHAMVFTLLSCIYINIAASEGP